MGIRLPGLVLIPEDELCHKSWISGIQAWEGTGTDFFVGDLPI